MAENQLTATQHFVVRWADSNPAFAQWLATRDWQPPAAAADAALASVAVSATGEQKPAARPHGGCLLACARRCRPDLEAATLHEAGCLGRCATECRQERSGAVEALLAMLRCPSGEACPPLLLPGLRAASAVDASAPVLEALAQRPEVPEVAARNLSRARLADELRRAPGGTLLVHAACGVPSWATWERAARDFGAHFPKLSGPCKPAAARTSDGPRRSGRSTMLTHSGPLPDPHGAT